MGLFDGEGGVISNERVAKVLVSVFKEYDIEPGELNQNINHTVELVREMEPLFRNIEEMANEWDTDIDEVLDHMTRLAESNNEVAESMGDFTEQLERTAESLNEFNKMLSMAVEEAEEE